MAVDAQVQPVAGRRPSARTLLQVLAPIGQILIFVVGGSLVLGAIVVAIALLLSRTSTQPNFMSGVLSVLPLVIIDGLVLGFLYATIALGYTMVYGVLEFINFAHGEIYMVGAYVGGALGLFLASLGVLPGMPSLLFVVLALLLAMAVSGLLAMAIERFAYRPLRNAPRLVPLISAIGISLILQDLVRLIAGPARFNLRYPNIGLSQRFQIAQIPTAGGVNLNVSIDAKSLLFIGTSLLILVGLNYLVNVTKLGKAIRAVAQDRATASLMGINVNLIIALTFLIGGALGGAAGVLFGIKYSTVNPYIGFIAGLKAFTAAVLGGIGNITGAMVGGIVLGLLEAFVSNYLTLFTGGRFSGPDYASVAAFLILIAILIFRPSGLLGEATTQKV
ncbi:MAG: branched-chain amino acid ABC transporter permease [Chloroflexota bacterium]|jgi:branched-chain amino acid transport system permease protein|nr:branched-chain amino acid ABC transporter permease [Chloroflexota bacterium]